MAWVVTEYPIGFPPRTSTAQTPNEVRQLLRLPWSQGWYTVQRIHMELS